MQVYSWHWMVKNIRLFHVKSERQQGDFKGNVFHNPVQANILNFISYTVKPVLRGH